MLLHVPAAARKGRHGSNKPSQRCAVQSAQFRWADQRQQPNRTTASRSLALIIPDAALQECLVHPAAAAAALWSTAATPTSTAATTSTVATSSSTAATATAAVPAALSSRLASSLLSSKQEYSHHLAAIMLSQQRQPVLLSGNTAYVIASSAAAAMPAAALSLGAKIVNLLLPATADSAPWGGSVSSGRGTVCVNAAGGRTQRLQALPQATNLLQSVRHRGLRNMSCSGDSSCARTAAWVGAHP